MKLTIIAMALAAGIILLTDYDLKSKKSQDLPHQAFWKVEAANQESSPFQEFSTIVIDYRNHSRAKIYKN